MAKRSDRAALMAGIAAGYGLDHEKLRQYARALDIALSESIKAKNVRHIVSCVRTLQTMVAQVQIEESRNMPGSQGVEVIIRYDDDANAR